MKFETRINENNQVLIPSYLVKKYNLESEDIIEGNEKDSEEIIIKFKKAFINQ